MAWRVSMEDSQKCSSTNLLLPSWRAEECSSNSQLHQQQIRKDLVYVLKQYRSSLLVRSNSTSHSTVVTQISCGRTDALVLYWTYAYYSTYTSTYKIFDKSRTLALDLEMERTCVRPKKRCVKSENHHDVARKLLLAVRRVVHKWKILPANELRSLLLCNM